MNQVAIVYWSGTGNTERMARLIAQGVERAGGRADLMGPAGFSADRLEAYPVVAFGCPAMGNEELEECEFEPMFAAVERRLRGRRIALFGSYAWADGVWMEEWCARCEAAGARLFHQGGLTCREAPQGAAERECRALGAGLANW